MKDLEELERELKSNNDIINAITHDLMHELKSFNVKALRHRTNAKTFNDLIPKTGGNPVINVIISTFRSGSTFMEEIFRSFPGTFLHHEVLMHYGSIRITNETQSVQGAADVHQMFHCNYEGLDLFLDKAKESSNGILVRNERVYRYLSDKSKYTKEFLSETCERFPVQAAKLNRLSLKYGKRFLEDDTLNIRMLFLFRDPRGVLNSRLELVEKISQNYTSPWSVEERLQAMSKRIYYNPAQLCKDLVGDLIAAKELVQKYPTRFTVVRYEDFAMDVFQQAPTLFSIMGLPYPRQVLEFIMKHVGDTKGSYYSTFRRSNETVWRWREEMTFEEVDYIQRSCERAFSMGGYVVAESENELKSGFTPIRTEIYRIHEYFDKIN